VYGLNTYYTCVQLPTVTRTCAYCTYPIEDVNGLCTVAQFSKFVRRSTMPFVTVFCSKEHFIQFINEETDYTIIGCNIDVIHRMMDPMDHLP